MHLCKAKLMNSLYAAQEKSEAKIIYICQKLPKVDVHACNWDGLLLLAHVIQPEGEK